MIKILLLVQPLSNTVALRIMSQSNSLVGLVGL